MCADYIRTNLADQFVRHYFAINCADKQAARKLIAELQGMDADEIAARFTAKDAIDLGWDFIYDEESIDPKLKLRRNSLKAGDLYDKPLKSEGEWRVVYCAERGDFDGDISYDAIESESLKETISNLVLASSWTTRFQEYMNTLEEKANVQVAPMPEGLPYDVAD